MRSLSLRLGTAAAAALFVSSATAWVLPAEHENLEMGAGRQPVVHTTIRTTSTGTEVHTTTLKPATYVEGEVLIKYRKTLTASARRDLVSRLGAKELQTISGLRAVHVKLPLGQTVEQALKVFAQDAAVEYVQPNFIYRAMAAPSDPLYGQQWGFRNTGQTVTGGTWATNNPGVSGNDMGVEAAWDHITDCRAVIVAVVDGGVNYTHQDLAANMWDGSGVGYPHHGYDFANGDNDPLPVDTNGHGTHVAATVAAIGNNGVGGTGVCWQARIMAVQVLSSGSGTTANVVAGVNFSVTRGAHVINMSLGGSQFDQLFSDAITGARNAGVTVVVASGNSYRDNDVIPTYPCNFTHDNLLCVAALDQAYLRASFSNWGANSVDVGAPGTNVLSAWSGLHIDEDFGSWNRSGAWTVDNCDPGFLGMTVPVLANPANWCAGGPYANDANDVAYRTYDFTGAQVTKIQWMGRLNLEQGVDYIDVARKAAGGDPFGAGGEPLGSISFPNHTWLATLVDNFNQCTSANCSLGFRLRTDPANAFRGVGIYSMTIDTLVPGTNATRIINGTSMATPHVTGLAALLRAYNPAYTYVDVIEAIKNGGRGVPALAGITTTGRAVDAFGSLRYINPPTSVMAVVQ